jgi:hypothetical protein
MPVLRVYALENGIADNTYIGIYLEAARDVKLRVPLSMTATYAIEFPPRHSIYDSYKQTIQS